MSRVTMPKRRAVSACPSSCRTTQENTSSSSATASAARMTSPVRSPWLTAIQPMNSTKVTCSSTRMPNSLPMLTDQRMGRLRDARSLAQGSRHPPAAGSTHAAVREPAGARARGRSAVHRPSPGPRAPEGAGGEAGRSAPRPVRPRGLPRWTRPRRGRPRRTRARGAGPRRGSPRWEGPRHRRRTRSANRGRGARPRSRG